MNDRLKKAFDEIHAEEQLKEKTRKAVFEKSKRHVSVRQPYGKYAAVSVVCGLVFFVGGAWLYLSPTAQISIDINPSVELGVNRFDKVVSVKGLNEDGRRLAETLDIRFADYEEAVEQVMENDSIAKLLKENEVITITVTGPESAQCRRILPKVQHCVEGHRNSYCYYAHSEEVKEAHSLGLSYGKYRAYLELKEIAPEILPEDVQGMTMKEIREWEAELRNMREDSETAESDTKNKNSAHRKQNHGKHMRENGHGQKGHHSR